jgi:hypothetical protein
MRIWILLHIVGFVAWMGGGFSNMLMGIMGRKEDRVTQGAIARLQAQVGRRLMAPGALVAVVTGVYLSVLVMRSGTAPSAWLMLMQGAGLLAALVVLFVLLPNGTRLGRTDPTGQAAPLFDALKKRQAIAGSIAGTLGLLALLGGVFSKY